MPSLIPNQAKPAMMRKLLALTSATLMGIATVTAVSVTSVGFSNPAVAQGCCTQTNGGGNVPGGNANGVPNTNKGGNAPPGQQ